MKRLHLLLSLSSLNVILVTIERFSPTTKILLQPYGFLRLHEVVQMTTLILLTVIIPVLIFKEVSQNKINWKLLSVFIVGIYFYATGNGLHEVSSFNFNSFCNVKAFANNLCQ